MTVRGWCPSLHEPMATGDGLLVRVKPPLGRLPAAAARVLADASVAHGNGAIELTGRGALQFRGLAASGAERFAAVAVGLRLAVADPAAERRRTVMVAPGADPATQAVALALEAALVADGALAPLPAKFCFAAGAWMDPVPGGEGSQADIALRLQPGRTLLVLDGHAAAARPDDAVAAALRLAHAFLALADGERRMRSLVARRGPEPLFAAACLEPVPFTPQPIAPPDMVGAALPFGATDAATLDALAVLAQRDGDGTLLLTPWRSILVPGLADPAPLAALGLMTAPDDPLRSVSACAGRPACAAGSVATRPVAARLRPPPGVTVHVSGCEKGCAHPGPATLTFVGRDGAFDLVRNGRASDTPVRRGFAAAEVIGIR